MIIGNPQYRERSRLPYDTTLLKTKDCNNTFAYFIEKSTDILRKEEG